jgi:hypothetical protein
VADFHLKAGTVVKHGTSSIHLPSILQHGLKPGLGRHELRKLSETTPKLAAVYVGELSAYFAAYASHAAVLSEFASKTPNYPAMAQAFFEDPLKASRTLNVRNVPKSVPVVLNIELGADVRLYGDEDYVGLNGGPTDDAGVWSNWRAGGVLEGIPAAWIKSFEFPHLFSVEDYLSENKMELVVQDMQYLACGAVHVSHKQPAATSLVGIPSGVNGLSNTWTFDEKTVAKFFACKSIDTPATLFFNQAFEANLFQALAKQMGFSKFQM